MYQTDALYCNNHAYRVDRRASSDKVAGKRNLLNISKSNSVSFMLSKKVVKLLGYCASERILIDRSRRKSTGSQAIGMPAQSAQQRIASQMSLVPNTAGASLSSTESIQPESRNA